MINVPTPNYYQSGNAGGSGQTISGTLPNYYNTFVNPQLGQQWQQYNNQQQMMSTGPSQQFGDQGSGKMGYGSQQNPYSAQRNLQNRQQLDQATLGVLGQGLTGQAAVDAINKQMGYDTGAVWDTVRGNIDIGTGGPNGVQYDRSSGGQYGAHDYNDAGMPSQGSMNGTGPSWSGSMQNQNDPMAWRRQHEMRQHQQPTYSGGYLNQPNYGSFGGYQPSPMAVGGNPSQAQPGMQYTMGLNGTAPSSFNNQFGAPTNHPMNQRLMY